MDLAMEVLAARYRLGEPFWTFRTVHGPALRALSDEGLAYVMPGVVEGTIRAGLTEDGKKAVLSSTYTPPKDPCDD